MHKNTILIVDDETFNLDLLEFSLESLEDIHLLRALNATLALETIAKHTIDLIILDISMPGMDGLEMLQVLKSDAHTKFIPVIMVTAKYEERHKALEYGSEDFLAKPIDVIELKFKVNNLLKLKKYNDLQQHFNQRLEEEISKKEQQLKAYAQVEQEIHMAKEIQQSLLPKEYPSTAALDIFGSCTQAHGVGGDYFDVFETSCGKYTICIMADVSGHGLASSLIAMQFRTLVRAQLLDLKDSFARSIARINTIFTEDHSNSSMFITGLFLRFNHQTKIIESVNAGHYNPLGNIEMIHHSGIPIGIMPHIEYETLETPFQKGNTILLYTDGIVEGENKEGIMYEKRFYESYQSISYLDSKTQVEALLHAYHNFIDTQIDDVTILAIRYAP